MTTTLRVNIRDINLQFSKYLEEKASESAQIEIKVESSQYGEGLFTEAQFWQIIAMLNWSQKKREKVL